MINDVSYVITIIVFTEKRRQGPTHDGVHTSCPYYIFFFLTIGDKQTNGNAALMCGQTNLEEDAPHRFYRSKHDARE